MCVGKVFYDKINLTIHVHRFLIHVNNCGQGAATMRNHSDAAGETLNEFRIYVAKNLTASKVKCVRLHKIHWIERSNSRLRPRSSVTEFTRLEVDIARNFATKIISRSQS